MYLYNAITHTYFHSERQSSEFILSRYLLHHLFSIENLTLSDISKQTSISKSSVSKYIKQIANGQNFSNFKSSLLFEIQQNVVLEDKIFHDVKQIESRILKINQLLNLDEIKQFAKDLVDCHTLYIYGDFSKINLIQNLFSYLFFLKKDIYLQPNTIVNYETKKGELHLIYSPMLNMYEYSIRSNTSPEIRIVPDRLSEDTYFLGFSGSNDYDIKTITIQSTHNDITDQANWLYAMNKVMIEIYQLSNKE